MASASAAPSTPFFTSTPNRAVTFAFPGVALKFGDGSGFAAAAADSALAAPPVAGFPSLLPARTGTAVRASIIRLTNHVFIFNIEGLSFSCSAQAWHMRGNLRRICQ